MKCGALAVALCLVGVVSRAELADRQFVVGDQQVWITVFEGSEIMTAGPNEYETVQILSGPDIEIVGLAAGADDAALVGVPALVAIMPGTQSCDDIGAVPVEYYVVWWGDSVATDGPLTSCAELRLSVTDGALVFEAATMRGKIWSWAPGKGFAAD
jgi:hypothetical protein